MALEKTWQYDWNHVVGDVSTVLKKTSWQLWYIYAISRGLLNMTDSVGSTILAAAITGKWTLTQCCDSTQVKTDGTDLLGGAVFDSTKWVRAAAGVAHSWCVLQSISMGGSTWYMIIDFVGAVDYKATIAFSKAAPTGGTTTARPTATDEWVYTGLQLNENTAVAGKMHSLLATDGTIRFFGSRDTSAAFQFALMVEAYSNRKTADQYPLYTWVNYDATYGPIAARAAVYNVNAWSYLLSGGGIGGSYGRYWDGTLVATNCVLYPGFWGWSGSTGGAVHYPFDVNPGGLTLADVIDGTWPQFPAWVGTQNNVGTAATPLTNPLKAMRGRLADIFWTPAALRPGDVDSAGSPTMTVITAQIVPCNVIPSL